MAQRPELQTTLGHRADPGNKLPLFGNSFPFRIHGTFPPLTLARTPRLRSVGGRLSRNAGFANYLADGV
jgi:hypothetical protein